MRGYDCTHLVSLAVLANLLTLCNLGVTMFIMLRVSFVPLPAKSSALSDRPDSYSAFSSSSAAAFVMLTLCNTAAGVATHASKASMDSGMPESLSVIWFLWKF